jgi:Ca2+-binding EF-hand superfamily protein
VCVILQRYQKQRWLDLTRRAFDHIDVDSDGKVSVDDLITAFADRIPAGSNSASSRAHLACCESSFGTGKRHKGKETNKKGRTPLLHEVMSSTHIRVLSSFSEW